MSKSSPSPVWSTNGKTYEPGKDGSAKEGHIQIPEEARSVSMPGDTSNRPYGQPIDAKLAVFLISNLFEKLNRDLPKSFLPQFLTQFKIENPSVMQLSETVNDTEPPNSNENTLKWLIDLVVYSAGITLDKNILLKTISQPECEGIRFYLCLKPNPNQLNQPDEVLSLVTVGVDKDGNDLHYNYSSVNEPIDVLAATTNFSTASLTGEYGHPPGSGGKAFNNGNGPYKLLYHAYDIFTKKQA